MTEKRKLLKTTDGGQRWTTLRQPADSVSFVTATNGWVLDGGAVYSTRNGGRSWTISQLTCHPVSAQIDMIGGEIRGMSDGTVWVVLPGGTGMNQESYTIYRRTRETRWTAVMARSTAGGGPAPTATTVSGPGLSPGHIDPLSANDAFASGMCWACGAAGTFQVVGTTDGT